MKAKNYIKFTLFNETDEDLFNNIFIVYILGILECVFLVLLIGEINLISITLFMITVSLSCRLAYKKGRSDALRRTRGKKIHDGDCNRI